MFADADASLRDALALALEANQRLAQEAGELRAENGRLRGGERVAACGGWSAGMPSWIR